jgi:hypothetical protein
MAGGHEVAETQVGISSAGWRGATEQAARRLAAITAVGGLLGLLVGGVGGRLAMLLLARLNPGVTGATSDDGFRIGQFTTADTINLLLLGAGFGVVGAGVYAVVRGLRVGPHWFQVLSIAAGPAVVVGAAIVHTDGVDFRLLGPPWLTIGLFVVIPGVYAALLTLFAEPLLGENGWFADAPILLAAAPLSLWIPLAPLLGILVLLWVSGEGMRRTPHGATALGHPVMAWAARLGLAAIFVLGLVDLGRDATELM